MKYFETGIKGGCYNEFQRGVWDGKSHWKADSLYLYDDVFIELELYEKVFSKAFDIYNRWGPNRVSREQWERLSALARECGGEVAELFGELTPWVNENFAEFEEFWIQGI